jgi:hypothetical protein
MNNTQFGRISARPQCQPNSQRVRQTGQDPISDAAVENCVPDITILAPHTDLAMGEEQRIGAQWPEVMKSLNHWNAACCQRVID